MDQNGAYLGSLDGKENRRILPDVRSVAFAAGRLLLVGENTLVAKPFEAAMGQARGEALPVAEGLFIAIMNYAPVTVSEAGVLLYQSGGITLANNQMPGMIAAGNS